MPAQKQTTPRVSVKDQIKAIKSVALDYISQLRNPVTVPGFNAHAYTVTPEKLKRPNVISVPDLLAVVATASRLGKDVVLVASGLDDEAMVSFNYADRPANIPRELYTS